MLKHVDTHIFKSWKKNNSIWRVEESAWQHGQQKWPHMKFTFERGWICLDESSSDGFQRFIKSLGNQEPLELNSSSSILRMILLGAISIHIPKLFYKQREIESWQSHLLWQEIASEQLNIRQRSWFLDDFKTWTCLKIHGNCQKLHCTWLISIRKGTNQDFLMPIFWKHPHIPILVGCTPIIYIYIPKCWS